jgi:hypothetical protein
MTEALFNPTTPLTQALADIPSQEILDELAPCRADLIEQYRTSERGDRRAAAALVTIALECGVAADE